MASNSAEQARLSADASRAKNWKRWGSYLSERQWATRSASSRTKSFATRLIATGRTSSAATCSACPGNWAKAAEWYERT
jgi:hypothetical protein